MFVHYKGRSLLSKADESILRRLDEEDDTMPFREDLHAPQWHEGRDGLPNMPTEMIVKDQGATALCLAAMGLHVEALNQFLQVSNQQ